jgi:DsbC/DsbD-like thiol-disulfide interchange protein
MAPARVCNIFPLGGEGRSGDSNDSHRLDGCEERSKPQKESAMTMPTVPRAALVAAVAMGWLCLTADPARLVAQGSKFDNHVKVEVTADKPDADGKQAIAVILEIEPGWHVYANPVERENFEREATKIKASVGGKGVEVKFDYPKGAVVKDDDGNFRIYEKKVTIKGTIQRDKGDARPVKLTVGFQPCNDKKCLQHTEIEREIP